jgi:hypothetical protein
MRNVFLATILAVSTKAIFAPRLPAQAQDQQCIKAVARARITAKLQCLLCPGR